MYRQLEPLNTKHRKTDTFNSYDDTQLLLSSPKAVLVTFQTYLDADISRLGYISIFCFVKLKSALLNLLYMFGSCLKTLAVILVSEFFFLFFLFLFFFFLLLS